MPGVMPGSYTVAARTGAPAGRGGPNTGPVWWAQTDVSVNGTNVDVALALQPGMTIAGRLIFEGASPRPTDVSNMRLFLVPPGSGGNLSAGPPGGQIDAQGKFTFTGVTPGIYWPTVFFTANSDWSLHNSTFNGRDAIDAPIDIKPGESGEWVLTFSDRRTELAGTLSDSSGRAAADYFVIVFPADKAYWTPHSRRVRTTRPGTDGKFSIAGLPEGTYLDRGAHRCRTRRVERSVVSRRPRQLVNQGDADRRSEDDAGFQTGGRVLKISTCRQCRECRKQNRKVLCSVFSTLPTLPTCQLF